jgi:hypothetical protein
MSVVLAIAAMLSSVPQSPPAALVGALPECKGQLSIGLDHEGGAFNGMLQSGVLLVVRNIGPTACKAPGLPVLTFQDAAGHTLDIQRKAPAGMHPGPVVLPVGLAAGAEATAALHWVSGDVFDGHHCLSPVTVVVSAGGEPSRLAWLGQLCGPAGTVITYDQPVLRTDPVLSPGAGARTE